MRNKSSSQGLNILPGPVLSIDDLRTYDVVLTFLGKERYGIAKGDDLLKEIAEGNTARQISMIGVSFPEPEACEALRCVLMNPTGVTH